MLWGLCCMLAFLTGVFFLKYLTAHPLRMSLYLSLTWACFFGSLILFLSQ